MNGRRRPGSLLALALPIAALVCACGSEGAPGGGSGGAGGGNVGFGGAQDIGQFRSILEAGGVPGEQTLDAGGFFAEHYSESPPADCGQPICLIGGIGVGRGWIRNEDMAFLEVGLSTPIDPATLERKPLNLVVILDTSGSMTEDDRIGKALQGLHTLIDQLQEGDRLALLSYSDEVEQWSDLSQDADRDALHAAVDGLVAAGGTNLYGGLERGFQVSLEGFDLARQNRLLLVSDGIPTIGVTDDAAIQAMADRYVSDGVGLTTVGVGRDFNVELMRGLAERGAGSFYFAEDAASIPDIFAEELDTFVTPLALSVEIQVASEIGWTLGEAVGARAWAPSGVRGGSVDMPAVFVASRTGDQGGEYGRRGGGGALFVALSPVDPSKTVWQARGSIALTLRYRLPDGGDTIEQHLTVDSGATPGAPDDFWLGAEWMAEHYAMYQTFLGLREATRQADWGGYDCAITTLQRLEQRANRWVDQTADSDIEADRGLAAIFQENLMAAGAQPVLDDAYDAGMCSSSSAYYYGDPAQYPVACSAGGGAGGAASAMLPLFLLAVAARLRRRVRQP